MSPAVGEGLEQRRAQVVQEMDVIQADFARFGVADIFLRLRNPQFHSDVNPDRHQQVVALGLTSQESMKHYMHSRTVKQRAKLQQAVFTARRLANYEFKLLVPSSFAVGDTKRESYWRLMSPHGKASYLCEWLKDIAEAELSRVQVAAKFRWVHSWAQKIGEAENLRQDFDALGVTVEDLDVYLEVATQNRRLKLKRRGSDLFGVSDVDSLAKKRNIFD